MSSLFNRMSVRTTDMLVGQLLANYPSPIWLESLLSDLASVSSLDVVLREIRSNPADAISYCSNLSVGRYYHCRGHTVEFLPTRSVPTPDMHLDEDIALEVKGIEDTSLWNQLIDEGRRIPSNYLVVVETDTELLRPQLTAISQRVRTTVSSLSTPHHEEEFASARLTYEKDMSAGWTRIIPATKESDNLNQFVEQMRGIIIERINSAKEQLRDTTRSKVAVIDAKRTYLSAHDVQEDVFCGTEQWSNSGDSRLRDGVVYHPDLFSGLEAVTLFSNDEPKRVHLSPSSSGLRFAKLGQITHCP